MKPGCGGLIAKSTTHQDGQDDTLPPSSRYGLGGALALRFAQDFHVVLFGRRSSWVNGVDWDGEVDSVT